LTGEAAVRVVRVRLDGSGLTAAGALALSAEERARAARLHRRSDARSWVAGRVVLRRLLGDELDMAPGVVPLATNTHGRPVLSGGWGGDLRFNLAHSGEVALYALAIGREVGIDIERVRRDFDVLELARRFFASEETAALAALPAAARPEAFCRCWTRKEAYLKALGTGLSAPLDAFAVPLADAASCRLLVHRQVAREVDRWWFIDLPAPPDHRACLAVEASPGAEPPRVELVDWPARPPDWAGNDRFWPVAFPPLRAD